MDSKKMTRGEKIKEGIAARITANRERTAENQRNKINLAIAEEEERVYKAAENFEVGKEKEPSFQILLRFHILKDVKEEFERDGFKFEPAGENWRMSI